MITPQIIKELIEQALTQQFLRGGPVEVPEERHESIPNSVPIGYLGQCPRASALKRRNHSVRFSGMDWKDSVYSILRVREGVKDENEVLSALLWAAQDDQFSELTNAVTQLNVHNQHSSAVASLHGRVDALIELHGEKALLEVKSSQWGKLYSWQVFQLLGYMLVTGINHVFIVQKNGAIINTYGIIPQSNGGFKVFKDDGEEWNHPINDPRYLNFELGQFYEADNYYNDIQLTTLGI